MFKNLFNKKKSLETSNEYEADVALRLMFEIAISDGILDESELNLIKKRADLIAKEDEKTSSIIKKIIDETEDSVSLYPTIKKINDHMGLKKKLIY